MHKDYRNVLEGEVCSLEGFLRWVDEKAASSEKGDQTVLCQDWGPYSDDPAHVYFKEKCPSITYTARMGKVKMPHEVQEKYNEFQKACNAVNKTITSWTDGAAVDVTVGDTRRVLREQGFPATIEEWMSRQETALSQEDEAALNSLQARQQD